MYVRMCTYVCVRSCKCMCTYVCMCGVHKWTGPYILYVHICASYCTYCNVCVYYSLSAAPLSVQIGLGSPSMKYIWWPMCECLTYILLAHHHIYICTVYIVCLKFLFCTTCFILHARITPPPLAHALAWHSCSSTPPPPPYTPTPHISVITQLLDEIREMVGCLHKLSECVAVLDMLLSFAHVCTVSPNYGETHTRVKV